ncbi:MAG: PAS domain S-box protein [Chitinophagales bacterium]|nr:PAS domain S-box protein [Chitinophagales bacterium]
MKSLKFQRTGFLNNEAIASNGKEFLTSFSDFIARELQVDYICIGLLNESYDKVRTVIFYGKDGILPNTEYNIAGTPCEKVVVMDHCVVEDNLPVHFEDCAQLEKMGIQSYLGCKLKHSDGSAIGIIYLLYTTKLQNAKQALEVLSVAANRIELELERMIGELEQESRAEQLQEKLQDFNQQIGESNEDFYRQFIEPSDIITTQSDSGIYTYVSPTSEAVLGFKPQEMIGRSFFDFLHPDDLKALREGRMQMAQSGTKYSIDYRMLKNDGSYCWLESTSRAILNENTQVIREIVTISRDITQRKEAQSKVETLNLQLQEKVKAHAQALEQERLDKEENKERYFALFNATFDSILIGDYRGKISALNPGAEQKFGYSWEEIAGKRFTKFLSPAYHHLADELFELYINQEIFHYLPGRVFEVECVRKNGTTFPAEISFSFWKTQQSKYFSCIIRDISERKKSMEKIARSERQLNIVMDAVSALISYVDTDRKYKFANKTYGTWFGSNGTGIVGKFMWEVLGMEAYKVVEPYADRVLKGEEIVFEEEIEFNGVGKKFVRGQYSPDFSASGNVEGFIVMITDLTSRKRNEDMLEFLNKAGQELSTTLQYQDTLENISRLAVPKLADWFAIDLYDSASNKVELLTVSHKDPEKVKWAWNLRETEPVNMNDATGLPKVLKTGLSELYKEIPDELIEATARDKEHLELLRSIGFHSVMIVPIIVGGKPIGGVTFVATKESHRNYTEYDLKVAEDFATRIGLALENARLYNEAREELEERKRTEATVNKLLREASDRQERLDNIIKSVPGIVWETAATFREGPHGPVIDMENAHFTFVSDYVLPMTGYTVEEWSNDIMLWNKIVHPDDREQAKAVSDEVFVSGKTGINQFRWIKRNGETIWVEAHLACIKDETGNIIGMRGVNIDVTALRELDQKKNDFLSIASHELKTPLTSIKAYVQLLYRMLHQPDKKDDTISVYLDKTNTFINKLSDLISDLLDVSKIQAGKMQFNQQYFDFDEMVQESIESTQHTSYHHTIILNGRTYQKVYGDKDRLEQVVNNLLSNAIKYSPNANKVEVQLSSTNGDVTVAIKDFGIGIAKEKLEHIFERFYRVESLETGISGLGIGLYISHEIVQRHQGKVWVESEEGRGSTFYFSVPIEPDIKPVSDKSHLEEEAVY